MRVIIFIVAFINSNVFAQKIDTLKNVYIMPHLNNKQLSNTDRIDSTTRENYKLQTIVNLLSQQSNVFIKNYGPSSFSTIAIRGSSAAQTSVKWQGLNISNAQHGLVDVNTLHTLFFDKIDIQYGSNIDANNIAGTLQLNSSHYSNNKLELMLGANSMKDIQYGIKWHLDTNKWALNTTLFYNRANSNFTYLNEVNSTKEKMNHARLLDLSGLFTLKYKLNKYSSLSNYLWIVSQRREIPKTHFETISLKNDTLFTVRENVEYKYQKEKIETQVNTGLFSEHNTYRDLATNTYATFHTLSLPLSVQIAYHYNQKHTFRFLSDALYAFNSYQKNEAIKRISFAFSDQIKWNDKLELQLTLKKENTTDFDIPFVYLLNMFYVYKKATIFLSGSKSYRIPTLNERYFSPIANANLKPEIASNLEAGVKYVYTKKNMFLSHSSTVYNRMVDNWILWTGASILYPHNISQVWSRGYEHHTSLQYTYTKVKLITSLFYTYTLSTTQQSITPLDNSIDKQLPYIPRYSFKSNIGATCKKIYFNVNTIYNGYRFITLDESQFLKPFTLQNIEIKYTTYSTLKKIVAIFNINNIWNTNYQSIVARPMPLRNFSLMMQFSFR